MNISKADLLALRGTHSVIHLGTRVLLLWLRSRWTLPEIISFLSSFSFSILLHSHPGCTRNYTFSTSLFQESLENPNHWQVSPCKDFGFKSVSEMGATAVLRRDLFWLVFRSTLLSLVLRWDFETEKGEKQSKGGFSSNSCKIWGWLGSNKGSERQLVDNLGIIWSNIT